jgi:hypothetical protein
MTHATAISVTVLTIGALGIAYVVRTHFGSGVSEPTAQMESEVLPSASVQSAAVSSVVATETRSTRNKPEPAQIDTLPLSESADEETRRFLRDASTKRVQATYSLLLEDLGLRPETKAALSSYLVEADMAGGWTDTSRGRKISEQERSGRIAAIIGQSKLQQFLALERNVLDYTEAYKIESLLQRNSVPIRAEQRAHLLKVLSDTREQLSASAVDLKLDSIDSLEKIIAGINEKERHVVELAPSVLSSKQVEVLFEQYQYQAEARNRALAKQKKTRSENPGDKLPLHFPMF